MYTKKKIFKNNILIIFIIFISLFTILLNTNKKLIQKEIFHFIDIVDTHLYKVTTFAELFNHNNIYLMGETFPQIFHTALKNSPSFFKKIPKYLEAKQNSFDEIRLNYNFKNYKTILTDRLHSIKSNVGIESRTNVNGYLYHGNQKYKIQSELKGKLIDHFRSPQRFSIKVSMKNDNYFFGMKEFAIQKPESRASLYEQMFLIISKNLGFIIPKHIFLNVFFNDKNWGIMNIEENPSKETLELQQFSGDLLFQFGNEKNKFIEKAHFFKPPIDSIVNFETYPIKFLNKKSLSKDKFFINMLNNQKFTQNIYNLFDHEKMCTLALLSIVWGSSHVLELNNTQYTYQKYSRKITPIPQDVAASPRKINEKSDIAKITRLYQHSCSKVSDKSFLLNKIKIAIKNSIEEIKLLEKTFPMNRKLGFDILYENINFLNKYSGNFIEVIDDRFPIEKIIYNKKVLKKMDIFNINFINEKNKYYLSLGNQLKSNIFIKSITLSGQKQNEIFNKTIELNKNIRGTYFKKYEDYLNNKNRTNLLVPIEFPMINAKINKIYFDIIIDDIDLKFHTLKNFSIIQVDTNHSKERNFDFFESSNKDFYIWKKGNWTVDKPLYLKKDLIIRENTNINFINQSYIYVEGTIKILGKQNNKVRIFSTDETWKGFFINSNDLQKTSIINNTNFSNLNSFVDLKFKMNGGINFFKSNIIINNVSIDKVYAEDAINFIQSTFKISDLNIQNTNSDALDSDFSNGIIENSYFKNITGDAVDTSGSNVKVKNTKFMNVSDKAISAGEKSYIKLSNLSFDRCLICVVSKDDSLVDLDNFKVSSYSLYFGASYKKKNFYKNGGSLNFISLSKDNLKKIRLVKDNYSKITMKNEEIASEINNNFKYYYESGIFN
jgi:hypothetical protein